MSTDTPRVAEPSQELREAARLMRERATLVPPPPWHLIGCQVNTDDPGNVIAQSGLPDRAQYIASMHPGVALAVADWLDVYAERFASWKGPHISAELDHALRAARAYLNAGES